MNKSFLPKTLLLLTMTLLLLSAGTNVLADSIVIDGCNSGVEETDSITNAAITDCAVDAKNHGDFVSCVADATNGWKKDGLIDGKQKGAIQRCAARADIPKCTSDIECDDSNLCTTDSCDPAIGCVNDAINCDDGDPDTTDTCDPETGQCVNTRTCADPCSDNNACTENDVCVGDTCTGTPITIDCDDGNPDTTDTCDPETGQCVNISCGDGTCDFTETCESCTADCGECIDEIDGEGSSISPITMNQKLFMMGTLLLLLLSL